MSERCRCVLVALHPAAPGETVEVEIRPATPSAEDLDAMLAEGDRGREDDWHIVTRRNAARGICGAPVTPGVPKPIHDTTDHDCRACEEIARTWARGGGWEGASKLPPGRQVTDEMRRWFA